MENYILTIFKIDFPLYAFLRRWQKGLKNPKRFLVGGGSLEGKVHLINWKVVCSPKEEGGLGIRKIDLLNKTLLGKWVWRYAYEKDNLWKTAIGVKYGQEGCGWRTKEVCGPYGVGLWKEIMKEADWCWESMDFKVGKGIEFCFGWISGVAMRRFLKLFLSCLHWRVIRMPKFAKCGILVWVKEDFRISPEEDSVRWKREGNGVFGAKGAYKSLSGYSTGVFPNRRIWMDKVPTKVPFFAWEAVWGKILTLDKLQKRGWQLPNRCYLCDCEEENANHILLHCTVVKTIWEITLVIFGVQWLFPESVIEGSQVQFSSSTACTYPRSPALPLGLTAAVALMIAQVMINIANWVYLLQERSPSF
ncbi:putative ribonuclease H protein [Vitis vinifera]|uniref:Putative ribonuclease H protein n=1 Tax=Vitis vinifera TaxID=29760 RepID=A0A438IYG4_VITVI|nr:putative ribonuclease H protein [Vitis vinifera]